MLSLFLVMGSALAETMPCVGPGGRRVAAVAILTSGERVLINGHAPAGDPSSRFICPGDVVTVGDDVRAGVRLLGADTEVRLDENSEIRFGLPPGPDSGLVELVKGALYFLSEVRRTLTIRTPYATAGVDGTEVLMRVRPTGRDGTPAADIIVLEGRVSVSGGTGNPAAFPATVLETGERLEVATGGALSRTETSAAEGYAALRRIAVGELSWTLFYPDILVADEAADFPRLREAARLLAAGQVDEAEPILAAVPDVGTEAGLRDALRAMIAVGRKDAGGAMALAERAAAAVPGSATAQLALSYARQAVLDLDGALAAAEQAAVLAPQRPLALARKAEIHLMRGETRRARVAAEAAVANGGSALADIVQGYADLAAARARSAESAFRRAQARASGNPLAMLGLGLALIRQGNLAAGRAEIESATVHDPSSSLLRSYLGKAYFEERRDEPAGKQLDIAKALDPSDPTPWFYDAIRKQLGNRPIEALRDAERSIGLNDNRAPYRSRLLLDEDAAARSASLGRIYDDLGFTQLGVNTAGRSLALDPANPAAHRFLSDVYRDVPRLAVARASELLQAQLLQDPNLQPVPPSLPFTDLDLVADAGPRTAGFNEFGPLFVRDGIRIDAASTLGSYETAASEAALSALIGRTAFSVGTFHYETDGFRRNFDLEHDIQNVFAQTLLTEDLNLQAEYRRRDSHGGDRRLLFDLNFFEPSQRNDLEEEVYRLGGRYALSPAMDLVLSYIHADRTFETDSEFLSEFLPGAKEIREEDADTDQTELQFLARFGLAQLVAGAGRTVQDGDNDRNFLFAGQSFADPPAEIEATASELYGVVTLSPTPSLGLFLRLGWDDVDIADERTAADRGMSGLTPGVGITWAPFVGTTLRAAASRTIKRPYAANQTLRPTQLAGFNLIYDEFDGTRADQLNLAVEQAVGPTLKVGASAIRRQLARELAPDENQSVDMTDAEDDRFVAFAYWMPTDRIAVAFEPMFERYRARQMEVSDDPVRVRTYTAPLTAAWFDPAGWYASARATLLRQEVERLEESEDVRLDDWGMLLDFAVGYRLPARRGTIQLRVDNLLDRRLSFQDESLRTDTDLNPRFIPARTFLFTATLNF